MMTEREYPEGGPDSHLGTFGAEAPRSGSADTPETVAPDEDEIAELRRERDRLREALQKLLPLRDGSPVGEIAFQIADAALRSPENPDRNET